MQGPRDAAHVAHGLPTLAGFLDDALELGVSVIVCQSGLALAGLAADALDPRIVVSGPLGVLAESGAGERLAVV
jgi:predicted peroxiredoxin